VPYRLACAQREIGLSSDCAVLPHPFKYPVHMDYDPPFPRMHFDLAPRHYPWALAFTAKITENYDVLHLHGSSLLSRRLDLPLHRLRGKVVVVHYHGSEIRGKKTRKLDRLAHHLVVSTPDLLRYAPRATWVPNPVSGHTRANRAGGEGVVIGHIPSSRERKGTRYLEKAYETLSQSHPGVELRIVENTTHREALRAMESFDVLVDQVRPEPRRNGGWYGIVANEAQAMGIPVVSTIDHGLLELLPQNPGIINACAEELPDALVEMVEDPGLRARLGGEGNRFVRGFHNPEKIARLTADLYQVR